MQGTWIVDDPEHWRLDENFVSIECDIPDEVPKFELMLDEQGEGVLVLGDILTMVIVLERSNAGNLFKGFGLVREAKLERMRGWIAHVSLTYLAHNSLRLMYNWEKGPTKKVSGYTLWTRNSEE